MMRSSPWAEAPLSAFDCGDTVTAMSPETEKSF